MALTRHTQPQITNVNNSNIAASSADIDADLREQMLGVIIWKVRRFYRLTCVISEALAFVYLLMFMGLGWALFSIPAAVINYAIGVTILVHLIVGRMTQLFLWLRSWKKGRFSLMDKF